MKSRNQILKWLALLFVIVFSTMGAEAQTGPYPDATPIQIVCITGVTEPYGVIPTSGSTYVWTVDGVTTSPNWNLSATNTNLATVLWNTAGVYRVQIRETTPQNCTQPLPIEVVVTVSPLPTATIGGGVPVCQNGTAPVITFTATGGTAPYIFTYNVNGGPAQTVTSTGNTATVIAPVTAFGTFAYNLVSVTDASGTACLNPQTGSTTVTVNELPTATIGGSTELCQNAPPTDITFTGTGGTAPYIFTYNVNGGPAQTVTTTTGNSVTVSVATTAAGVFAYNLVSVADASGTICSQAQTGTATVTVTPLPVTSPIYHN